jgi:adenylyltransferase/sulfurtransferase
VGRTLLSAAVEVAFDFHSPINLSTWHAPPGGGLLLNESVNHAKKSKINLNSGGQECPPHTGILNPARFLWHHLFMPQIQIPTPLRQYAGKQATVQVPAKNVGEALSGLITQHPGLKRHLYTDDGKLRAFVNVYVNDEDMRYLEKEATALKDGDTISIVPSIAGGA